MAERDREGIGAVGRKGMSYLQYCTHHLLHLIFIGLAVTDNGLLHFKRGIFVNIEAGERGSGKNNTPGMSKAEGRLYPFCKKHFFHDYFIRSVFGYNFGQGRVKFLEPYMKGFACRKNDPAGGKINNP